MLARFLLLLYDREGKNAIANNGGKDAMKKQIIKKIMACLLAGAMVITTPMTASATELKDAYSTDKDDGWKNPMDTSSGTSTSTNTSTQAVDIPEAVQPYIPRILGIALDKAELELKNGESEVLQARALFDDYDPTQEEMAWMDAITAEQKKKIEGMINWYCDDYDVATFETGLKTGSRTIVNAKSEGVTKVYAWIEADGIAYPNAPMKPTAGDYVAEATVTVRNELTNIKFTEGKTPEGKITFVSSKRQYDLRKYTKLFYTDDPKEEGVRANKADHVNLTYSVKGTSSNKVKASVTEAGILKITKGAKGDTITINIVSDNGIVCEDIITLGEADPVKTIAKFNPNKGTLDLGFEKDSTYELTRPAFTTNKGKTDVTTDEFIWSSNKPSIVEVAAIEGEYENETQETAKVKLIAKGVGTAKITVKASSGKNAVYTVTVYATPDSVEITGDNSTYTGKPVALKAVFKGDNGQVLPNGTTKVTWAITKVKNSAGRDKANPYAKVKGKKDEATVTPVNLLKDVDKNIQMTGDVELTAVATFKDKGQSYKKTTTKGTEKPFKITVKQSNLKDVSVDIFTRVNSGGKLVTKDVYTMPATNNKNKETYAVSEKNMPINANFNGKFYVGQNYLFTAKSGDSEAQKQIDSIAWAVTGKGISSDANGENLATDFTGNTKSVIKASYITLNYKADGSIKSASKNTKTINITPIQNATSIGFSKPIVVKTSSKTQNKAQNVKFTINQVVPKKAKFEIPAGGWKIKVYRADGVTVTEDTAKNLMKNPTAKAVTITVPGDYPVGSVIKVGAYTNTGVVAYGYIYITEQTTKVLPKATKKDATGKETTVDAGTSKTSAQTLKLGETLTLSAELETKYYDASGKLQTNLKKDNKQRPTADGEKLLNPADKDSTKSYLTEPVTYSLDKKSALVVKVDNNGKVTPLKKGSATVTIKTLSGKSAKVKINVTND